MNSTTINTNIRHGGDLQEAQNVYGGNLDEWLDLSTGISPWSYPAPILDESFWRDLPPSNKALIDAAAAYYGCDKSHIVSAPGSQLAIRLIPQILEPKQTVAIPLIGYQEHVNSWQMAGHTVLRYQNYEQLAQLINTQSVNNAVVINPNNPTGETITPRHLKLLSENLAGILLIDEAFSDFDRSCSIYSAPFLQKSNIVVLKSMGKFFGLAGVRVGFAIGTHSVVKKLDQLLSPWSVSGPSVKVATLALKDNKWQTMQRQRISESAKGQRRILDTVRCAIPNSRAIDQNLFFSIFADNDRITELHAQLAEQRIWTRLGDSFSNQHQQPLNWLRLSLAGDHLSRLSTALETINTNQIT